MKRVLFTGNTLNDNEQADLRKRGFEIVPASYDLTEDQVATLLKDCDGYILGGDEIVTESMLEKAGDRLRAISFFGAGYEKYIDTQATKKRNILVANTPGANAHSVAEFSVALMLAATKGIVSNANLVKSGSWDRPKTFDLAGKTIGIIGMGNIGAKVTKMLHHGFGAKIIYYSRKSKFDIEASCDAKKVSLEDLLKKSDIISIHASLTDETRNLIGKEQFTLMKDGVIIVNTARVEILNEEALVCALNSGKVSACAFDGFYEEPIDGGVVERHDLLKMEDKKIIVTPHMAYYTSDAISKMEKMAIENVLSMLSKGTCDYLV